MYLIAELEFHWEIGRLEVGVKRNKEGRCGGRRQREIDESWLEAEVWGKRQAVGWPVYTVYLNPLHDYLLRRPFIARGGDHNARKSPLPSSLAPTKSKPPAD